MYQWKKMTTLSLTYLTDWLYVVRPYADETWYPNSYRNPVHCLVIYGGLCIMILFSTSSCCRDLSEYWFFPQMQYRLSPFGCSLCPWYTRRLFSVLCDLAKASGFYAGRYTEWNRTASEFLVPLIIFHYKSSGTIHKSKLRATCNSSSCN